MFASSLRCPNCKNALELKHKTLSCTNNHCFDQAKQGYFNLLLSNKKKSKQPGDNTEMVMARKTFLETGIYQPISDRLNKECLSLTDSSSHSTSRILDIGCGEGYYTHRLQEAFDKQSIQHELIGLDISKEAVRQATKRSKEITWLVASGSEIPVIKGSQDIITCLFTRLMPEGMAEALFDEGSLITVTTGKNHLLEMREILYPTVKDQVMDPYSHVNSHFELTEKNNFSYQYTLESSRQIMDLLAMTPHQWRAPEQGRKNLSQLDKLTITIDVVFSQFKKFPN